MPGQMDGGLLGAIIGRIQQNQKDRQEKMRIQNEAYDKARQKQLAETNRWKQNYMKDAIRNAMKAQVDQRNQDNDAAYIASDGSGPIPQQQTVYQAYGMPDPQKVQHYQNIHQAQQILADDEDYGGMYGAGQ